MTSSLLQDALNALAKSDSLGARLYIETFMETDKRDETIRQLYAEKHALESKLRALEEEHADLQARVNLGLPRQNKKGSGAHYAIKKLGRDHVDLLLVLKEAATGPDGEGIPATSWATGLTTDELARRVRDLRELAHDYSTPSDFDLAHSLSGRLSELQNAQIQLVKSEYNDLVDKDGDGLRIRHRVKGVERWFLTARGQAFVPRVGADPRLVLQSYSVAEAGAGR